VARYENDCFGVILPGGDLEAAKAAAQQVRRSVATTALDIGGAKLKATASVGVSSALAEDLLTAFVSRADSALYAAHEVGGDRAYYYAHGKCEPVVAVQMILGSEKEPEAPRVKPPPPPPEGLKTDRRSRRRAPFARKILVAPYVPGTRPTTSSYFLVQCHDISATGISFFLPAPPVDTQFVLTLGSPPDVTQVIGRVVRTANMSDELGPKYLVGCSLAGRL
jgi:hypothetical protein